MRNGLIASLLLVFLFTRMEAQTCTNCGVGTVAPLSKFEIRGCTNDATTSSLNVTTADSTSILYVRNDKKVGVNTTSPSNTLDVRSGATGGIDIKNTVGNPQLSFFEPSSLVNAKFTMGVDDADADKFKIGTTAVATSTRMTIDASGNTGIGVSSPTATLHLKAGTATANTAPLKFSSGTNLTSAEAGAMEFDGTRLYYTTATPTRITLLGNNFGISGGTTLVGGTASGDDLTLQSTSNATKGNLFFGTSTYDEVNNRLGIGTTSPAEALDVNGVVRLAQVSAPGTTTNKLYNVSGSLYWNGTNLVGGLLPSGTSGQTLRHDGTNWVANSLLYNNATNVGINTTGPDRRLDVLDASNPQMRLTYTDGTVYTDLQTTSSGYLYINNTATGGTRVGIGTSTPGYALDVSGNSGGTATLGRLQNTVTAAANSGAQMLFAANRTTSGLTDIAGVSGIITDITSGAYKGALVFSTANNAAPAERMRIDNAGNVGIGTTSPGSLLDVNGSIRAGYNTGVTSYLGNAAVGYAGFGGGASFASIANNNGTDYALLQHSNNNTYLNAKAGNTIVFALGHVAQGGWTANGLGIGTTTPSANSILHVKDGHIRSQQTTAPTIAVTTQNGITAAAITSGSSDTKGNITTTGTNNGTNTVLTITFNMTFAVAPTVVITSANANAQACTYYVGSSTTTFTFTFKGGGATPSFNYMIIE